MAECTYYILMVLSAFSILVSSLYIGGYINEAIKYSKTQIRWKPEFPSISVGVSITALLVVVLVNWFSVNDQGRLALKSCGNSAKISYLGVYQCQPS